MLTLNLPDYEAVKKHAYIQQVCKGSYVAITTWGRWVIDSVA